MMDSQTARGVEKQASLPQPVTVATPSFGKAKDIGAGVAAMATIQDDDERLLTRIGYKQVDLTITRRSWISTWIKSLNKCSRDNI